MLTANWDQILVAQTLTATSFIRMKEAIKAVSLSERTVFRVVMRVENRHNECELDT